MFIEVRHPLTNKFLFRYDQGRQIVELMERGLRTLIDLTHDPPLVTYHGDPLTIARMAARAEQSHGPPGKTA